jgi:NAD(P)-dependent dehydrogenase (short-subunit alcohol dehydrogenase family)
MAGLLAGHIAAVTGGGSGIGQGICQAYAREGARVIVLDANIVGASETVGLVTGAGGKAIAMMLDVTDRQACGKAAGEIAKGGNISILVNNAGINRRTPFTGDKAAVAKDWDDILSINLDGMFNVTHAFLDQLRATKGRIVNSGSIQSFVHVNGWPNSAAYTTSKHGVLGFTRSLAAELGKEGVRVNAIGPGMIATRINADARAKNPYMVAACLRHTPLNRIGTPGRRRPSRRRLHDRHQPNPRQALARADPRSDHRRCRPRSPRAYRPALGSRRTLAAGPQGRQDRRTGLGHGHRTPHQGSQGSQEIAVYPLLLLTPGPSKNGPSGVVKLTRG